MDRACSATALQLLPYYCNKAPNTTFAKHAKKQDIVMTTKDLQELLTHSSPVNDEMINLYLELLCTQYNLTYLCTDVIPALCREGWPSV
jgi:Ulp1 family protease